MSNPKGQTSLVGAPAPGWVVDLKSAGDQTFASGALGAGVAVIPESREVAAPVSGTVVAAFPTGHAFGIASEDGVEVLVHIGVDTVKLKGEHFTALAVEGQRLRQGDPLARVDFAAVGQAGYQTAVIVAVTNTADFAAVEPLGLGDCVARGAPILRVTR
ncbi:MAG: PTS glucose transporter subunit IIA [Bifidobacteriaceae bacterium]|jgi:PTS system beta-glucosides-specific IIC component|nr:PTS glucose transporter subunit IIA [Bifidobacteriaceae bacterium]